MMKVVGLVVVVISIGSSVVAAPSSNSAAASASTAASAASRDDSELERRKLGYAAVPNFNATPLLFYAIVQMHFYNFFCFFATFYLLLCILGSTFPTWTAMPARVVYRTGYVYKRTRWSVG